MKRYYEILCIDGSKHYIDFDVYAASFGKTSEPEKNRLEAINKNIIPSCIVGVRIVDTDTLPYKG